MNTFLVIAILSMLGTWEIQVDPRPFTYESCMQEKRHIEHRITDPKKVKVFCFTET